MKNFLIVDMGARDYHKLTTGMLSLRDSLLALGANVDTISLYEAVEGRNFSDEKHLNLRAFDVILFSCYYSLQTLNLPRFFVLNKLNIFHKDRFKGDPVILGGGLGLANPLIVKDIFDGIYAGEAESFMKKLVECSSKDEVFTLLEKDKYNEVVDKLHKVDGNLTAAFVKIMDDLP